MKKQVTIEGTDSKQLLFVKLPYLRPHLVELDLISTEASAGAHDDGIIVATSNPD
jgi:hypothetical protein